MKHTISIIIATALLCSCSVTTPLPQREYISFVDYRPYALQGFNIYTTDCNVKHTQLGEIQIHITPELKEIRYEQADKYDSIIVDVDGTYGYEFIDSSQLLEKAVTKAKELGANGISHLKLNKQYIGNKPQYTITGICIIVGD